MNERTFVLPYGGEKAMAIPFMRQRILLSPDMEIDGFSSDQDLEQVMQSIDAPRQKLSNIHRSNRTILTVNTKKALRVEKTTKVIAEL